MTTLSDTTTDRHNPTFTGLAAATGAFLLWGLVAPVYFKLLTGIGAVEIVAHRVVWTVLLVGAFVLAARGPMAVVRAVGTWRRLGILAVTTALVSSNWLIFIYATLSGQMLQSSLGYYINPLVNVLLGVVFLHERLSRQQMVAVAVAAAGVLSLVLWYGVVPWIALALAVTFGIYALVRKKAAIEPVTGLLVETGLLIPPALGYLLWLGPQGAFVSGGTGTAVLLALAGPITAVPLVLFMVGAARLKLSTIGLLQYIGPTGQLLLGVLVYGETFTPAHAVAFGCIWVALVLYSHDAFVTHRAAVRTAAAAGD
ncbi:EamA family transporter RarD [Azospirillum sp. TSO22-1]|uniref:EamA family transporter RarD n=1 Tax=Azospirillum sp. TSO22-1 TaxID=716789 RepID=UPI000D643424|nr:EamA family transporter RarD [Azospirillum sp. TSO22-1]